LALSLLLQNKLFYHLKPIHMKQEGAALHWFEIVVTDIDVEAAGRQSIQSKTLITPDIGWPCIPAG
jgi:hypothetical protein